MTNKKKTGPEAVALFFGYTIAFKLFYFNNISLLVSAKSPVCNL